MQQPDLDIPLKIGTRGSELALWQAHHVRDELRRHWGESLAIELEANGYAGVVGEAA